MSASIGFFSAIVGIALLMAAVSPVLLVVLLIKDWKGGKQW